MSSSADCLGLFLASNLARRWPLRAGGGLATFDRNGNLSIAETVSLGGQILPLTFPGTYTVNSDCTGSLTAGSGFSAVHLNLVIVRTGREILAVNADPGRIAVDNFVRQ